MPDAAARQPLTIAPTLPRKTFIRHKKAEEKNKQKPKKKCNRKERDEREVEEKL